MTAVALKPFDREPRTQAPRMREPAEPREFANLVEKQRQPAPKEATKQIPETNEPSERAALHAQQVSPTETSQGGVPEAIPVEVSVELDLPALLAESTDMPESTDVMLASSIADFLPTISVGAQALPVHVEDEISDGIPVAIEAGLRPKLKRFVDEDAITMAVPIMSQPERQGLSHARTELQLPIVGGTKLPDEVPVLLELVAKLAPVTAAPVAAIPLTPLEQAVQDLIAEVGDRDDRSSSNDTPVFSAMIPEVKLLSIEHADAPAHVAQARGAQQLPEQTNPSHVHLVIDDGAERVVITVAVRGSEVNVALRGQDDATTAALARNAGSLDHAMRARGLDLASLMTGRDPDSQQRPDRDQRERDRNQQTFSLEELA